MNVARRVGFILACALIGMAAACFGQPLVRDNSDAILIIVTVLTVFAGFLVAIIAILGDPMLLPRGSWRAAEGARDQVYARVAVHTWLFRLYLFTIALLFAGVLVKKLPDQHIYPPIKQWIERLYMFFGAFSFSLTLALPNMLARLQMARIDAEIDERHAARGSETD